jgi:hypothetical protein
MKRNIKEVLLYLIVMVGSIAIVYLFHLIDAKYENRIPLLFWCIIFWPFIIFGLVKGLPSFKWNFRLTFICLLFFIIIQLLVLVFPDVHNAINLIFHSARVSPTARN